MENYEPLLRRTFGHKTDSVQHETRRSKRKADDGNKRERETCLSNTESYLNQARAMVRKQGLV